MSAGVFSKVIVGGALLAAPMTAAFGQGWSPGAELVGHSVQVETNGIVNTVHFDAGGAARIQTPAGRMVPATWSASGSNLCLTSGGAQECWAYAQPFQTGQQVTMTSSCQVASRWLPLSTGQMPVQSSRGERG